MVRGQIAHIEHRLRATPDDKYITRSELEKRASYWEDQLDTLDRKATRAGVPRAWRE